MKIQLFIRIICILGCIFSHHSHALPRPTLVAISQVVEHPALNRTVKGIEDEITELYGLIGKQVMFKKESVQGNIGLAGQVASRFIAMQPDVVVGVGTLSAQTLKNPALNANIPLVFSSVTDPVGAGLVSEDKHALIAGVSNFIPLEPQLAFFKEILGNRLKTLGILYNPSELNSVKLVEALEKMCPTQDIILLKKTVTKPADIPQNTAQLAQHVDAIFISNDNTALSALKMIVQKAEQASIPVFVSDIDAVKLGAIGAYGPDQYDIGRQTGRMIFNRLESKDVANNTIEYPKKMDMYLNDLQAEKLAITFSEAIRKKATNIFDGR